MRKMSEKEEIELGAITGFIFGGAVLYIGYRVVESLIQNNARGFIQNGGLDRDFNLFGLNANRFDRVFPIN